MSPHAFMGRLKLLGEAENGGFQQIRDDLYYSDHHECLHIPKFDFEFVQDGSQLIPTRQGLIITGHPYWNYIIGPGRIWLEKGDHGYSRASFPFALVERNANAVQNGVMTFLFNGMEVSNVRYQSQQTTRITYFVTTTSILKMTAFWASRQTTPLQTCLRSMAYQ
ncbi:MAG: hypothetical protein MUO77_01560 [Anaerolineales bacterium]|nr:hypothetical protein [Anaerolineales bacterium]